LTLWSRSNGR